MKALTGGTVPRGEVDLLGDAEHERAAERVGQRAAAVDVAVERDDLLQVGHHAAVSRVRQRGSRRAVQRY